LTKLLYFNEETEVAVFIFSQILENDSLNLSKFDCVVYLGWSWLHCKYYSPVCKLCRTGALHYLTVYFISCQSVVVCMLLAVRFHVLAGCNLHQMGSPLQIVLVP